MSPTRLHFQYSAAWLGGIRRRATALSVPTASSKSVKLADLSCQRARSPGRVAAFGRSFTALAGELFDAAILIFSPLAGLRPSRSGRSLTLELLEILQETASSLAAALTMLFNTLSKIACACALICRELLPRL